MATETERLDDLVPEILLRLPLKSLKRFQYVNKSWYHLIRCPYLISKHHLHAINKISSSRVTTNYFIDGTVFQIAFSLLSIDRENGNLERNDDISLYVQHSRFKQQCPYKPYPFLYVCGPCNGVYCLNRAYPWPNRSMLINPSKREFRVLPKLDTAPFNQMVTFGFGFDQRSNDYKVFWIMAETGTGFPPRQRVFLYSLNSDSWRESLTPFRSFQFVYTHSYAISHGAFHRLAGYSDGAPVVLAFDMAEEVFKIFKLPQDGGCYWMLANFKETIAASTAHPLAILRKESMDFWIMGEYGNESSWFKCLKVEPIQEIGRFLGTLWDEDVPFPVQDCNRMMALYDLRRWDIKEDTDILDFISWVWKTCFYVESLVSLRRENE